MEARLIFGVEIVSVEICIERIKDQFFKNFSAYGKKGNRSEVVN